MKKNLLVTTTLAILVLLFINGCKKGDMTQEDIVAEQQKIAVTIRVVNASDGLAPVSNALVKITTGEGVDTANTNADGIAFFEEVSITSSLPVTITKTDYTSVSTTITAVPANYRQAQISEEISVYELTGDNIAVIRGRLLAETDVTNRVPDAVPAGLVVRAYNNSLPNSIAFIDETDAEGNYEINVPVSSEGNDDILLVLPEFTANQTVAIEDEENNTASVVQRPVSYNLQTQALSNSIPGIPSVYATVEAPTSGTAGSGFALTTQVIPTALSTYSSATIINGGSGYTNGTDVLLDVSAGSNGATAQVQVDIVNGSISNIDGLIDDGALYTSQPTVATNVQGGSGAVIQIQFYADYNLIIDNNGAGYTAFPEVFVTGSAYTGTTLVKETENLDNILGSLDAITNLRAGSIVNDNFSDGDTIYTFESATVPVITVVNKPSRPILLDINAGNINPNTGEITSIVIDDNGAGYLSSTHPVVTFTTLAGYGSGAVCSIDINTGGTYSSYDLINPGSGYVQNVNDFNDDGTTGDDEENPSFSYGWDYDSFTQIYNVMPGSEYLRSANYGTGIPEDEE